MDAHTHTHTHTHIYIYLYIYIYNCYYEYQFCKLMEINKTPGKTSKNVLKYLPRPEFSHRHFWWGLCYVVAFIFVFCFVFCSFFVVGILVGCFFSFVFIIVFFFGFFLLFWGFIFFSFQVRMNRKMFLKNWTVELERAVRQKKYFHLKKVLIFIKFLEMTVKYYFLKWIEI